MTAAARDSLRRRLARTRPALAHARRARAAGLAGRADWGPMPRADDFDGQMADGRTEVRSLVQELIYAARDACAGGDHGAAVDYLLDAVAAARAADDEPSVVCHLLATGMYYLVADEAGIEA